MAYERGSAGTLAGMTQPFDENAVRHRLHTEQERVEGLIESLREEGIEEEATEQVGGVVHVSNPADQGSDLFEREKDVSILEQLERDLAEIEAALQRLDDGTYGIDEVTGEPIEPERLDAFPAARTNLESSS